MSERRPRFRRAWIIGVGRALSGTLLAGFLVVTFAGTPPAAEPGNDCASTVLTWIGELDADDQALITRRTKTQCTGAARWMKEQTIGGNQQTKRQICQDLVLLWIFKECVYQRDYIERRAYEPCMAWSREMHQRCLADDLAWFEAAAGENG